MEEGQEVLPLRITQLLMPDDGEVHFAYSWNACTIDADRTLI